jgi:hypothetical protein
MDQIFIEKKNANSLPFHLVAGIAKKIFRLTIGVEDAGMDIGKQKSGRHRIQEIVAPLQDFAHVFPLYFCPQIARPNITHNLTNRLYSIPPAKKVNISD